MDRLFLEKGKHEPGVVIGKHNIDFLNLLFQESGKHVIHCRMALLKNC